MKNIIGIWSHWLYSPYYSMHPLESLYILHLAVTERGVKLSVIHTNDKTDDERYDTVDLMKMAPDQVRPMENFCSRR